MEPGLLFDVEMDKGAEFSPCRLWRYSLWRNWGSPGGRRNVIAFCGLNPSTADEYVNDNTVTRCIRFAKRWGHTGMVMLNAYGYRATDPKDMMRFHEPIGAGNDEAIVRYANSASMVIAAWGVHCDIERERKILEMIDRPVYCLGKTKEGRPKHPLYLPNSSQPIEFYVPELYR